MRSFLSTSIFAALLAFMAVTSYALLQDKGLAAGAIVGLFVGIMVFVWAWKRTDQALALAFIALICVPFFLGVNRSPKIFLNELPLFLVLGIVPMKILLRVELLNIKPVEIICLFLGLLLTGMTMLHHPPSNIDLRTYFETLGLGVMACLVCAQEATQKSTTAQIAKVLTFVVLAISLGGIVETIAGKNPIMTYAEKVIEDGFTYMSAEVLQPTGASYRPYVTFFHPSEGATVVALCLPFIAALWGGKRWRPLVAAALVLASVFFVLNATRGVWLALLVAGVIFWPSFRRATIFCFPVAILAGALVVLFFGDSGYMERILDIRNLQIRFFFWDLALTHLEGNWFLGLGYGYFKDIYLTGNVMVPADIVADVTQVSTVDNSFLMILVEQGLIGLIGYFLIWGFLFQRLTYAQRVLSADNRPLEAAFARAGLVSMVIFLVCSLLADVHLFWVATKIFFMLTGLGWGLAAGRGGGSLDRGRAA